MRVKCLAQEHNIMSWPGLRPELLAPEASPLTMRSLHNNNVGIMMYFEMLLHRERCHLKWENM